MSGGRWLRAESRLLHTEQGSGLPRSSLLAPAMPPRLGALLPSRVPHGLGRSALPEGRADVVRVASLVCPSGQLDTVSPSRGHTPSPGCL